MEHDRPLPSGPANASPPAPDPDDSDEIPVFDRYGNQVPTPTPIATDAPDHTQR